MLKACLGAKSADIIFLDTMRSGGDTALLPSFHACRSVMNRAYWVAQVALKQSRVAQGALNQSWIAQGALNQSWVAEV